MWRTDAPPLSPVRRGEVSELERSPGGTIRGRLTTVDTEELFPLHGFQFKADSQVYPETRPFLMPHLPVTFEPRAGEQATNIGLDYARLPHGTLDSFNGQSGWLTDERHNRSVYFDRSSLLGSDEPLKTYQTKLAYLPSPDSAARALLVYPGNVSNGGMWPASPGAVPPNSRESSQALDAEDLGEGGSKKVQRRRLAARRRHMLPDNPFGTSGPPSSSRSASPLRSRPSLPSLPRLSTQDFTRNMGQQTGSLYSHGAPSSLSIDDPFGAVRMQGSSTGRLALPSPFSPVSPGVVPPSPHALPGYGPPRSPLRRRASPSRPSHPLDLDPFAGSEGFERMPAPSIQRNPFVAPTGPSTRKGSNRATEEIWPTHPPLSSSPSFTGLPHPVDVGVSIIPMAPVSLLPSRIAPAPPFGRRPSSDALRGEQSRLRWKDDAQDLFPI